MTTVSLYLLLCISTNLYSQSLTEIEHRAAEYFKAKNYSKALRDCKIILKQFPENTSILNLKGKVLLALNQLDAACICFIGGIEQDVASSKELFIENCDAYSPKLNLEKFKSGKFIYEGYAGEEEVTIIRKKNLHIEHFKYSKTFVKSEIHWRNHNAYQLKIIDTNDPVLLDLDENFRLNCKVIAVYEDYYIYYAESMGSYSFGKLKKIK